MDEKDKKILKVLKEDSSLTTRQIAKKTLMPITTVHKRIKKLKENEIITRFTIEVNNSRVGLNYTAYILLKVDITKLRELKVSQAKLINQIKQFTEVESAHRVVGKEDIVLKVTTKDVKAYDNFLFNRLHQVKGIRSTSTLTITDEN